MIKHQLLNAEMAQLATRLGHTDEITIADAGLPIPQSVQRIDLALTHGIPAFLDTVKVWLASSQIEGAIIANEFALASPTHHDALVQLLTKEAELCGKEIPIEYMPHAQFKARTQQSHAVIRTGECTPYANVIFKTGVVF